MHGKQTIHITILFIFLIFNLFLIEVYLIYNVVLVSGVQQSDSVIYYIYILFHILFPYGLLQDINIIPCAIL